MISARLVGRQALLIAGAALVAACGSQAAPPNAAPGNGATGAQGAAAPAGCPAVTPLALPTLATGPGGPGGRPGGPGGPSGPGGQASQGTPGAGFPDRPGGGPGGPGGFGQGQVAGTPMPLPTLAPAPSGALAFKVTPNRSTAKFRVREQLAGISFPSDAVGCTGSVTGQLTVQPDGKLVPTASQIVVDVRDLKSDSDQRDNFIKGSVMQAQRFPQAVFVPTGAEGLPGSLPANASATFKLTGQLTVHGVTKEQTWDVTAQRQGSRLTGNATTSFKFADYGMQPPRVPMVLSVVDEIRLEVQLEATQGS